jgi:predicted ATPase
MKISRLRIQDFCQFQNLDLDLTYPQGHEKAGQPLDKICIIGQNGTGKTTILNIINDFYMDYVSKGGSFNTSFIDYNFKKSFWAIDYIDDKNKSYSAIRDKPSSAGTFEYTWGKLSASKMLYFPFGINSQYIAQQIAITPIPEKDKLQQYFEKIKSYYYATPDQMQAFEEYTFSIIEKYQKNSADFKLQLVKKIELGEKIDILEELKKWQAENPNPLLEEAKYLDGLINKFHLRTKTILDRVSELNSIQLESMVSHETIPYEKLSSGTRQILNVARPLYHLLVPNAIVLMDEPETSLYPDLQRDIIPYYTNLREDLDGQVQYFFSTHSPIVASSFDPWEIIDLEFDENGFVKRHLYYEGENHIDNYTIHPKYLRWDSILSRIFDLKVSGNELREDKIFDLANLRSRINYLQKQGRTEEEISPIVKEYKQLLKMMDWKQNDDVNI